MERALVLSKYIVNKCINDQHPISNLQLQKILYYIQKDSLQRNDMIAFPDEIQAWRFGPVVPNSYYYFCGFAALPLTFRYEGVEADIAPADRVAIDNIVEEKRQLMPWVLVKGTHVPGGAWDTAYNNGAGNGCPITAEMIKKEIAERL